MDLAGTIKKSRLRQERAFRKGSEMNGVWLERDIGGTQYNRNTIRKVPNDRKVISKSTEKSIPHL